jgi:peptide/nickel transport system substrate-binding protein
LAAPDPPQPGLTRRAALTAALAAGAASSAPPALAAAPRTMLVIGTDLNSIPSLDPAAINARTVSEVLSNLYDNLVTLAPDDLATVRPMLAERWQVAPDKRSITFTLRDDARFASGNKVTADDAAWSIRRVVRMGQVGTTDIALWGFTRDNIDDLVRATDPRTLEIRLPEPVSTDLVLASLASSSLGIIDSRTALAHERDGDLARNWLKSNAAASGPYTLLEWRPGDILLCEARANYWGGAPPMRRVVMRHIPESANLRLQLQAGDVDVGQYMTPDDLAALSGSMTIDAAPGFGFYYIALNTKDPDLGKPLVRQAFQHLLDWKSLAGGTMRYVGTPWQSVICRGMPGAPSDATGHYDYDPDRARALLMQAGYPNGLRKRLFPSGPGVQDRNCESLQASAKLAGIQLDITPGEHTPDFRARNFDVLMGNSGARLPDPFGTCVQYAYNPDNRDAAQLGGYYLWRTALEAPQLTQWTIEAKREAPAEARTAIFRNIDRAYHDLPPSLIVFFQRTDASAVRGNIHGYRGHPTWSTRWNGVSKT